MQELNPFEVPYLKIRDMYSNGTIEIGQERLPTDKTYLLGNLIMTVEDKLTIFDKIKLLFSKKFRYRITIPPYFSDTISDTLSLIKDRHFETAGKNIPVESQMMEIMAVKAAYEAMMKEYKVIEELYTKGGNQLPLIPGLDKTTTQKPASDCKSCSGN